MRTTVSFGFIISAWVILAVSALEIVEPAELSGITLSTPSVGDSAFNLDQAELVFVQGVCSEGYNNKNNGQSGQPHGKPAQAQKTQLSLDSVWTKRNEQQNNNNNGNSNSPHGKPPQAGASNDGNNGNNSNGNGDNNNNGGNNGNSNSPHGKPPQADGPNGGNNGNNNNGGNNGNSNSPHGKPPQADGPNNGNNGNSNNGGNNGNNNNGGDNGNSNSPHGKPPQAGGSNNNQNDTPHGKPPKAGPKNPNNGDPEETPGSQNAPSDKKRGKPPHANPNSDKTKKNNKPEFSDIEPVGQSFEDPTLNLTGKIVLTSFKGCSSLQQAWNAEQSGAVAIIIAVEGEPGYGKFKKQDGEADMTVSIPIFEISNDDFNILADYSSQLASNLVVALPADDPNPWEAVSNDGLINLFTIAMVVFSAAVIGFGLFKWILLFKYNSRRQLIVPSIMIVFEIISAIFRAVYAGDPLNMRGVYSYLTSSVLQQLPNAFWYMATVAICFFWIDNVLKPSSSIPRKFVWLSKTRYAFIGIGVLFIGVDLTVGLLRGLNKENRTIVLASGVVYASITALLAITFIILGVFVLRAIKRVEGLSFFKKEIVQKQTRFLILNGFSMISMAVLHVLLIDFILDPISYYAGLFTLWSLMTLSSCSVLMMIHPKPAVDTSKERSMSTASTGKTSSTPSTPRTLSTTIDSSRSGTVDNV